jgi:hypothetical protein
MNGQLVIRDKTLSYSKKGREVLIRDKTLC